MTPGEWLVAFGGLLAIAWVNWWFFFAERADRRPPGNGRTGLTGRASGHRGASDVT